MARTEGPAALVVVAHDTAMWTVPSADAGPASAGTAEEVAYSLGVAVRGGKWTGSSSTGSPPSRAVTVHTVSGMASAGVGVSYSVLLHLRRMRLSVLPCLSMLARDMILVARWLA